MDEFGKALQEFTDAITPILRDLQDIFKEEIPEPTDRAYSRRKWKQQRQAHQAQARGNFRDVRPLYHALHEQRRNGGRLDRRG